MSDDLERRIERLEGKETIVFMAALLNVGSHQTDECDLSG